MTRVANRRRLPVRSLRVIGAADSTEAHHSVECPRRQSGTPFAECCGCTHKHSIDLDEDGVHRVDCRAPGEIQPHGRVDVAEAAIRVRLGDLIGTDTTCVRSDVRVEVVADLLVSKKVRALPVVDMERRLVGMVSKTDLLRSKRRGSQKTAADIMSPLVHGLPESAPVAYAISLMGFEGLNEVPVVDRDAQVIGMITSTDALRWVAESLGYVVPGSQGG